MQRFVFLLFCFALCWQPPLPAQQQRDEQQEVKWERLEGCRLMTNALVDGDSFRALYKDREYIFRLYFVDAPETDAALKDRITDQSAYFGVAASVIPRAGRLAADFTRDKLAPTSFTVITRWQNAMGRSSLARFYAVVLIGTNNLAEELVSNGFARIYGLRANWPGGLRSTTFINKLKNLELTAREQKRGIWDETRFPRNDNLPTLDALTNNGASAASTSAPAKQVDLNNATVEELQSLPGIGPVLAQRIIERRPFKTAEELDDVPGVGPVTMERLRPLIRVEEE
jgi:competence ComEA-like helix-hairpin-helix protein